MQLQPPERKSGIVGIEWKKKMKNDINIMIMQKV
jgi:hypothetical protein